MRISELAKESGASVATIKYYPRESLLPPGEALNARESSYGQEHLERLRLIRGLVGTLGVSIDQVRRILAIIDDSEAGPWKAMGEVTAALPTMREGERPETDRASAVLGELGFDVPADLPAVRQLNSALAFVEDSGIPVDGEHLAVYASAARDVARADVARIPRREDSQAVSFAVLGTVLFEPVLLSMRRIAHYELGRALSQADGLPEGGEAAGRRPEREAASRGGDGTATGGGAGGREAGGRPGGEAMA